VKGTIAFGIGCALAACGRRAEPAARTPPAKEPPRAAVAPDATPLPPLDGSAVAAATSLDDFVALFETLDGCGFDESLAGLACERARDLYDRLNDLPDLDKPLGERLLSSSSPDVRYAGVTLLFYENVPDIVQAAIEGEQDSDAHAAMGTLVCTADTDPSHAKFHLALLVDTDARLRRNCAHGAWRWEQMAGARDALVAMVKQDTDDIARANACWSLGWWGDTSVLAFYKQMLVAKTAAPLYNACFQGLTWMWLSPTTATPGEDAYRFWLDRLSKGPLRSGAPSRELPDAIDDLPNEMAEEPDWFADRPWIDLAEMRPVLEKVAASKKVDADVRQALTDLLASYPAAN
jgi:hypothetical protein